jgi:exonuclease III
LLLSGDIELNPGPPSQTDLSFATLNIRSASSITWDLDKPTVLRDFILRQSIDILLLSETWLSPDSPSSVLNSLIPPGFSLFHKPRSTGRGGGLAVIFRSSLSISEAALSSFSSFESLCFTLTLASKTFVFLGVYRPPSSSLSDFFSDLPLLTSL